MRGVRWTVAGSTTARGARIAGLRAAPGLDDGEREAPAVGIRELRLGIRDAVEPERARELQRHLQVGVPGRKRDDLRVELAPRQERRQAAARVEVAARGVEALDDAVDQRR